MWAIFVWCSIRFAFTYFFRFCFIFYFPNIFFCSLDFSSVSFLNKLKWAKVFFLFISFCSAANVYCNEFRNQLTVTIRSYENEWTNEKKVNKFKINKTVRKNKLAIQFYRRNNLLMTVWKKNAHSKKKRQKKFVLVCSFWPKNQVSPIITWTRTKNFENYQVNAINFMLGLHVPMCNVCICICELYIVYKRWSFISTLMHTGLRHQSISLIFIIFSQ